MDSQSKGKLQYVLELKTTFMNGLPSAENPYIFNGDFVDRGKRSIEVLVILLSCFLLFPGYVYLNRGNHEDHIINLRYGFVREMRSKYKQHADRLLVLIERLYRWLPLGTLIDNKVFVVHGGISDVTDLTVIRKAERQKNHGQGGSKTMDPDYAQQSYIILEFIF
ncbi:hypothetical protein J437_LFUL001498 [Ladona fulva]|uniref:Serine/threonine-protein phosphatase n=1 Tax=Ladona fulva TaxID=123851 RepID=A0A8K0JWP3_LADFU|nr:hypothetical protein J437_LFUL001498 [Ladona fulva]